MIAAHLQWPARRRPLAVFTVFEISWIVFLAGLTPSILWEFFRLWANNASSYLPLCFVGYTGMLLSLRHDDPPILFPLISFSLVAGMFFFGLTLKSMSIATSVNGDRSCEGPGTLFQNCPWSGSYQLWANDVPRASAGVVYACCALVFTIYQLPIYYGIPCPSMRYAVKGAEALRYLWRTIRAASLCLGSLILLLGIESAIAGHVLRGNSNRAEREHNRRIFCDFLRVAGGLLVAALVSSPRVRIMLHLYASRIIRNPCRPGQRDLPNDSPQRRTFQEQLSAYRLIQLEQTATKLPSGALAQGGSSGSGRTSAGGALGGGGGGSASAGEDATGTELVMVEEGTTRQHQHQHAAGSASGGGLMPMDKQQQQSAHHGLPANTPFGSGSTTTSTAPTTLTTAAKDYAKGELFEPEAFFHLYSSCGAMDPWAQADLEQQASPPPGASSEDRANTRMRTRAAGDDPIATDRLSSELKLITPIGLGGYSTAVLGELSGERVAVKVFARTAYKDTKEISRLWQEVQIALELEHPNVVRALGTVILPGPRPALVLELMPCDALSQLLHQRPPTAPPLEAALKHRLIYESANGLSYLHSMGIVHSDIKTANVLLDADLHAKLSDFGIATRFGMEQTASVGTARYMAPEVIFGPYNHSADVYSFGMFAWEVVHVAIPFHTCNGLIALLAAKEQKRPQCEVPTKCDGRLAEVIHACWQMDPTARPVMREVMGLLRWLEDEHNSHPLWEGLHYAAMLAEASGSKSGSASGSERAEAQEEGHDEMMEGGEGDEAVES